MDDLNIISGEKDAKYLSLIPQIEGLVRGEPDIIANMAKCYSSSQRTIGWLWVGFYIVKNDELVLGPFQGPVACTRIQKGRGVCGVAWQQAETLIVPDVEKFKGHIACSSLSKSEIVIPIFRDDNVVAVLDVDSENYNYFDETDKTYLEEIVKLIKW